jgi:glycosyltransferase involved in cell wall biosynthesis
VNSVLFLDISRLIWRARRRGPSGIDRVELAYAEHFIARGDPERPAYAVLHLFGFLFALSPAGGRRFIEALCARWHGEGLSPSAHLRSLLRIYGGLVCSRWLIGPSVRRAVRRLQAPPVFLVVSHHHVARPYTIARIRRSLGARTVCLIHDLIPIECPEYFPPGWEARYRRLIRNLGVSFDAVIANSESTARALRRSLPRECAGAPGAPQIRTAPLGVQASHRRAREETRSAGSAYFVVLGTIEPRKNHLLLLNLWTRLAAEMQDPPRLLVIGARGWENEQVVDMLERSSRLRDLVAEHNGLSDALVRELVHGARALLSPSFAEGFGLPVAEALALGVPVICSDLPVFREIGQDVPEYLDPLDIHAWSAAVRDYRQGNSHRRASQLQRLARWQAPRWAEHFSAVEQLLGQLAGPEERTPRLPTVGRVAPPSRAWESP